MESRNPNPRQSPLRLLLPLVFAVGTAACGEVPTTPDFGPGAPNATEAATFEGGLASSTQVFTSGSQVLAWDPIFPPAIGHWPSACTINPAVTLGDPGWGTVPHPATAFGTATATVQRLHGTFTANWINAWENIYSRGNAGQSWTKYSTTVYGDGDFVLYLLADNCSWIYLDGQLVGFQGSSLYPQQYPLSLSRPASNPHALDFIIWDGGGEAGGMFRLETNSSTTFPDTDGDGLADISEPLYGTNPNDPDSDDDGVNDGDEVDAGTNPTKADTDGDGVGDGEDEFPLDPTRWVADSDGDGVADDEDAFPNDPTEWADSDGDGVGDNGDPFPTSDQRPTIVVGTTDTGVANQSLGDGSTMGDRVGACANDAKNHGQYVSCVAHLATAWRDAGLITGRDHGAIVSAAGKSSIGKKR